MTDRWQKIEQLYHAAQERDVTLRGAYLHEACAGDDALRQEIERLLAAGEKSTANLESPIQQAAAPMFEETPFEESPTQSLVGRQLGVYHVLSKIGEGGMGEVYRALDTKLRRDVALKVLPNQFARDPERLTRFRREAQLLASLNHKNIASIYGFEETAEANFLVLELVEGETFAERIKRQGPLPAQDALTLAGQVAEGLEAAHRKGITHRDIKPPNIKVTPEGDVKVLDFGLAKVFEGDRLNADLSELPTLEPGPTCDGQILGTPSYMSPEQVRGQDVDKRTDIWAFDCVLFELLTGQRPFRAETVGDTIAQILEREPDWEALPPSTPLQVQDLLRRCLTKGAEKRLHDIREARDEIQEALAVPLRRRMTRRQLFAAAGVALVALVAAPLGLNLGGVRDRLLGTGLPAPIQSIAVLPLENLSGDPEQDYFAEGMHDALITDLSKLSGLQKVIARASVMRYRDTDQPLSDIARELGVEAVITGSVVREGDRVRITAQLIDAETEQQLWADRYERQLRDVLSLQNSIVTAITQELQLQLTPQEQTRLATARPVNPEAYEAYLQGRFHHGRLSAAELDAALQYYELALEKDPNSALAYSGISFVWAARQQMGLVPPQEAGPRAREAALKALELDDTLAETHHGLAVVRVWTEWDWEGGAEEFQRAIELNPNFPDARAFYSHLLMIMKRLEEATVRIERALELDPHNSLFQSLYASILLSARRYDDAIAQGREARRTAFQNPVIYDVLRDAFFMQRMYQDAFEEERSWYAAAGDREVEEALVRGYAEGGYPEAMRLAGETLAARSATTFVAAMRIAQTYVYAGQKDKGLDWLEKSYQAREPDLPYISAQPVFDTVRDDPRFQDLLRRMNLPL